MFGPVGDLIMMDSTSTSIREWWNMEKIGPSYAFLLNGTFSGCTPHNDLYRILWRIFLDTSDTVSEVRMKFCSEYLIETLACAHWLAHLECWQYGDPAYTNSLHPNNELLEVLSWSGRRHLERVCSGWRLSVPHVITSDFVVRSWRCILMAHGDVWRTENWREYVQEAKNRSFSLLFGFHLKRKEKNRSLGALYSTRGLNVSARVEV